MSWAKYMEDNMDYWVENTYIKGIIEPKGVLMDGRVIGFQNKVIEENTTEITPIKKPVSTPELENKTIRFYGYLNGIYKINFYTEKLPKARKRSRINLFLPFINKNKEILICATYTLEDNQIYVNEKNSAKYKNQLLGASVWEIRKEYFSTLAS